MKISVYVPCHNSELTLGQVLAAIKCQTRPADQLIVIDDRSTDQSGAIAIEHGFEVHTIAGEVGGLARARNRALKEATGEILLGIDSDVVIEPNYIQTLEQTFNDHPSMAAVGGRMDERFVESPPDLWRAIHFSQHHGAEAQINPRLLFGCTFTVRAEIARKIGGWNEQFWTHYEDKDISSRLMESGHLLLYTPRCQAWHLRRDTVDSVLRTAWAGNYFGFEKWFSDIATWAKMRAPLYWPVYLSFVGMEKEYPQLAEISARFPWAWAMRDINALRQSAGDVGDLTDLAAMARQVMERLGIQRETITAAQQWLQELALSLDPASRSRGPLRQEILMPIRDSMVQNS